jgi:hypothetical protein
MIADLVLTAAAAGAWPLEEGLKSRRLRALRWRVSAPSF